MFRRKRPEDGDSVMTDLSDSAGTPAAKSTSSRPPGTLAQPSKPASASTPAMPQTMRPGESPPRRAEGAPIIPTPPKPRDSETRRLFVGREISLSGEITSCERLVVEGSVEANLTNCREVEIGETGLFKGAASIDEAEIRGRFEGSLTVRKRLFIRATGKVNGTVRYGQLEVECGGQVAGDVQTQPFAEEPEVRPARIVPLSGEIKSMPSHPVMPPLAGELKA